MKDGDFLINMNQDEINKARDFIENIRIFGCPDEASIDKPFGIDVDDDNCGNDWDNIN